MICSNALLPKPEAARARCLLSTLAMARLGYTLAALAAAVLALATSGAAQDGTSLVGALLDGVDGRVHASAAASRSGRARLVAPGLRSGERRVVCARGA